MRGLYSFSFLLSLLPPLVVRPSPYTRLVSRGGPQPPHALVIGPFVFLNQFHTSFRAPLVSPGFGRNRARGEKGNPRYRSQSSPPRLGAPLSSILHLKKGGGGTPLSPFVLGCVRRGGQQPFDLRIRLQPRPWSLLARGLLPAVPTRGMARTAAGALRSQVCRDNGLGSSGTSPELRRPTLGAAFSPRPHLDVVFAGCGAELF
ncbi:hypothetical protein NDU88_005672 [Pleurodeles waltl]|uniref:Secreted protein n=1 Tax=Pleurodeles waltl TaxID=8319 RepID=A0AAV7PJ76_PLEWA|nr:hypothetical protein NDU88_005672 [Pleurodeles waltl]